MAPDEPVVPPAVAPVDATIPETAAPAPLAPEPPPAHSAPVAEPAAPVAVAEPPAPPPPPPPFQPSSPAALQAQADARELRERMDAGEPSSDFVSARYRKSLATWKQALEEGSPDAMWLVGRCTDLGLGVSEDAYQAAALYRRSAEAGHAPAAYSFGYCLSEGSGVPKEEAQALVWYERAAQDGFTPALAAWGEAVLTGTGTAQDIDRGLELLARAADAGNPRACARLGELLSTSQRPERLAAAQKYLRVALDAGFLDAGVKLALLLGRRPDTASKEEGARLLDALAEKSPEAAEQAALLRIRAPGPKDRKRIAQLLERASKGDSFSAHFEYACSLDFGWGGGMPDTGRAIKIYQQIAKSDPRAQVALDTTLGAKVDCPRCELPHRVGRAARECPFCGLRAG